MTPSHHALPVLLSLLVAVAAAYTTLSLAGRVAVATGAARRGWLASGALAMGVGIWSMHFTGMLALHLRYGAVAVPVTYEVRGLLTSLVVPIAGSAVALGLLSRPRVGRLTLVLGGHALGAAISGMHYLGMAAMHSAALVSYRPAMVVLSIAVAVAASVAGVWLALRLRDEANGVPITQRAMAAVMLGLAIAGTHYTAMAATRFVPQGTGPLPIDGHAVLASGGLAIGIAVGTLLLLTLLLIGIATDRRLRVRLVHATTHQQLYEAAEAARAEATRTNELLQEQAVELEQQLEEMQALASTNEELFAEVQASAARFRGLVEAAYEGVWALDPVGQTTYVNPRMCALLGLDEAAIVGKSFFQFLDEDSAFEARTRFARPQRGLVDAQELSFWRADGSVLHGIVAVSPIPDAAGQVDGVLVLVHDATEQKRAETALRESEARFRELFERNPLPMWVYDPESLRFLAVNDAAVRHYGWAREEFLDMGLDDVHPAECREPAARDLEALRTTRWGAGRHTGLVVHQTKGGHRRSVEVTADAVTFSGRTARLALLHDVTERLAAEQALQTSNERFGLVQRATNDLIWDHDLVADRLVWSDGLQTTFRYPADEPASAADWWRERLHPEDRDRVLDTVQGALMRGDESWVAEYRFRRGDGTYAYVLDRGYALRDGMGRPVRLIGAMQDVSERESLAAQLRQAQRLETVGRLAGGIAHDFNNLLTVIIANTEFARETLPGGHPAVRDLGEALDAARRAEALTRQLLTFSRKQVWQPQVVDINRTVAGLHRMFHRLIGEDLTLSTALVSEMWPVTVDPGQLEQVLANLIVNARDAMPDGGTIELTTETVTLDAATVHAYSLQTGMLAHPPLTALPPGDYVALSVVDSGVGIPAEVLPHICEPFYTTKPEGQGTGLGLATVYGVVRQAGGAIVVNSTPDVGTRVTIFLARDLGSTMAEPMTVADPAEAPGGRETVLLVEDEPAVRAVIHRMLTSAGYTVFEASNGAEALALWEQRHAEESAVDVVLTDAVMPVLGGHALAERLRAKAPDVRVILMSGYTAESSATDAALVKGAASAFLQKPLTGETLLRAIRQVLDSGHAPARRTSTTGR